MPIRTTPVWDVQGCCLTDGVFYFRFSSCTVVKDLEDYDDVCSSHF